MTFFARAFGVNWRADLPLDLFEAAADDGGAAIEVNRCISLPERELGIAVGHGWLCHDGFRLKWGEQATFDMFGGQRIDYLPGPEWPGTMPVTFSSTVAALTLAWRGMLPLHASAVEWAGRAVLIAGPAGAGKSTLSAGMIARGARLIGDDLTVIDPRTGCVTVGRPAMRLHRDTAQTLEQRSLIEVPDDPRGKVLVAPAARYAGPALPVGAIVLLGGTSGALSGALVPQLLSAHRFRPKWQDALPGREGLLRSLIALAGNTPAFGLPTIEQYSRANVEERCGQLLTLLGH